MNLILSALLILNQFMPNKFQQGGEEEYAQFLQYQQALAEQQSTPDYSQQGFVRMDELNNLFASAPASENYTTQPEYASTEGTNPDVEELRLQNDLLQETISRMESIQAAKDPEEGDRDLDMFMGEIGDNDNVPMDPDEMFEYYASRRTSQAHKEFADTFSQVAGERMTSDSSWNQAMMQGESGGNQYAKNPNSSASGAYQFVKGTLKDVYNKTPEFQQFGSFETFNKAYNNSPQIQEAVMNKYTDMGASVHKDDPTAKALWHYGPKFAKMYVEGKLDLDKRPADYGVGVGVKNPTFRNFIKTHTPKQQKGGFIPTAYTEHEQYKGLNGSAYNEMFFNNEGVNLFRGLDNYQPVYLEDEKGTKKTLYGPKDTAKLHGKVYERKLP